MDTLTHILSYAGDYQFRFIGGVCRRFKKAYLITFSGDKHTYINAKTEGHARNRTFVIIDMVPRKRLSME